jgi:hypothetical protein
MSRGWGQTQWMVHKAFRDGRVWTFDQLCRFLYPNAFEPGFHLKTSAARSLRRALARLVEEGYIIALGSGGRASPYRYAFNPNHLWEWGHKELAVSIVQSLEGYHVSVLKDLFDAAQAPNINTTL